MAVIFFCLHLLASNYILAARSKGEVLLYRDGYAMKVHNTDEEGVTMETHIINGRQKAGEANKDSQKSTDLHKHTITFHWSGLGYEIKPGKETKQILNDMHGWAKPGTLTALMVCLIILPLFFKMLISLGCYGSRKNFAS
jgi:ATP-binding cassette subfamily G (WHITE) protein 2 (PDR)